MKNTNVKESLFQSLIENDEDSLADIIKDLFQERLEKRAFDLYTEELQSILKTENRNK